MGSLESLPAYQDGEWEQLFDDADSADAPPALESKADEAARLAEGCASDARRVAERVREMTAGRLRKGALHRPGRPIPGYRELTPAHEPRVETFASKAVPTKEVHRGKRDHAVRVDYGHHGGSGRSSAGPESGQSDASHWEGQGVGRGVGPSVGGFEDSDEVGSDNWLVMEWESGDRYEGEASAGLPHGLGAYHYACGDVYRGEWYRGRKHGLGVLSGPPRSGVSGGNNAGHEAHGDAASLLGHSSSSSSSSAAAVGGLAAALGAEASGRGEAYEGGFAGNVRDGMGVLRLRDGRVHRGYFKGGDPDG